jgi:ATP-dependent Clp protease ATP-binding subunit ClpA
MNADRFTIKSQDALRAAIDLAAQRSHAQVQPEHLLDVLLSQDDSLVPAVLGKLGVAVPGLRSAVTALLDGIPTLGEAAEPTTSSELAAVLRDAEKEMRDLKDDYSPRSTCCWRSPGRRSRRPVTRCVPPAHRRTRFSRRSRRSAAHIESPISRRRTRSRRWRSSAPI